MLFIPKFYQTLENLSWTFINFWEIHQIHFFFIGAIDPKNKYLKTWVFFVQMWVTTNQGFTWPKYNMGQLYSRLSEIMSKWCTKLFSKKNNIFWAHFWNVAPLSMHCKFYKIFYIKTVVRSAAAVLRLAALRPQLRLRLWPEVKPQLLWKNPHSEEKLENKSN